MNCGAGAAALFWDVGVFSSAFDFRETRKVRRV